MLKTTILAAFFATSGILAQQITVVSAAGYQKMVAPNSLASMFGTGLSSATASAQLDSNGELPTQLAGVSVEINGQLAPLIFVSPSQINLVIPENTITGTANVVVRSTNTAATQAGSVDVESVVPALFSLDSSGAGPGAILNAVTYNAGPFLVETQENPGDDKRTRLAVYATGLRNAVNSNVKAQGRGASGNTFQLAVEYAGPAPGFFGLDQVNVVLPPEADGAGTVSLTVTANSIASNSVTFIMNSLPASQVHLASLTLAQSVANGTSDIPATVSLNAAARLGGYQVMLRSNISPIQTPAFVTIPQGQVSAQFTVHASAVPAGQTGMITASGQNGDSLSATLQLAPANGPTLVEFAVNPAIVGGGGTVSATVTLSSPAPATGTVVQVSSDSAVVTPPMTVTVQAAQRSATFNITTSVVTSPVMATLTAALGAGSIAARLTVNPLLILALSPNTVLGGGTVTGTVTLATPAPAGGANILIQSSDAAAQVPVVPVIISSGQTSATFTINTVPVSSARMATITASYARNTSTATLTVNPPGAVTLASLTLNPTTVTGGTSVTGTVTLTDRAPINGINVQLVSSSQFAQLQQAVLVPSGQMFASFTITTVRPVSGAQTATITATYQSVSKPATLTIQ